MGAPIARGMFQLIRRFFVAASSLHYSPEIKTQPGLKGQAIIYRQRLQFDVGWTNLGHAFLSIRQTVTAWIASALGSAALHPGWVCINRREGKWIAMRQVTLHYYAAIFFIRPPNHARSS